MNLDILSFYRGSYSRLGKQTCQLLESPRFMERVKALRDKWKLDTAWQKSVLEDYIERIDFDLRIKANEEHCFELEERLTLSPELRFHHGLDRALVDLYIRLELFKSSESEKAITSRDPRKSWDTFMADVREACVDFSLMPADALFIYRNLLALPLIDIVREATSPHIEIGYQPETGVNIIKVEMTDDALRYFSEEGIALIKDAILELKQRKDVVNARVGSGKVDMTWYYKNPTETLSGKQEADSSYFDFLVHEASKIFTEGSL